MSRGYIVFFGGLFMNQDKPLTISKFAHMTGIKRDTLRFYDRIGLLSPEMRGKNGYRYYSHRQINSALLFYSLRKVGIGLDDIKQYSEEPTPERIYALCLQHGEKLKEELRQLQTTHQVVQHTAEMIREAFAHKEHDFFLQECEQEPIFLCAPISTQTSLWDGGYFSYEHAEAHGVDTRYPSGVMLVGKSPESGDAARVNRYYFKHSKVANACKSAGLYAVAYGLSSLFSDDLYNQLLDFIAAQGLRVCGDIYVECPFGMYVMPQNIDEYCLRIEIPVRKP